MSGEELAAPLGALPPVKIHCAQLVEGALRNALSGGQSEKLPTSPTLIEKLSGAPTGKKIKIVMEK
jgi:nitrogen fixation NifU-like protein